MQETLTRYLFGFKSRKSVIERKILSAGDQRRFWFGSRREWISCWTSSQHAWMGCQQWSGQVLPFSSQQQTQSASLQTSPLWSPPPWSPLRCGRRAWSGNSNAQATIVRAMEDQPLLRFPNPSSLLIFFLISCWINSVLPGWAGSSSSISLFWPPFTTFAIYLKSVSLPNTHLEIINFLLGWRRLTVLRTVNFLRSFSSKRTFFGIEFVNKHWFIENYGE